MDFENATAETAELYAAPAAPRGYEFTSANEQKYMNLYDVDVLRLCVAKNGAIAGTPITINLQKSDLLCADKKSGAQTRAWAALRRKMPHQRMR